MQKQKVVTTSKVVTTLSFLLTNGIVIDIIIPLPPPIQAKKGGLNMEDLISVLRSIVASVSAYYICKWLDRMLFGNQPKE